MSATVLYMSMSLDGFIDGPGGAAGHEAITRLHAWVFGAGEAEDGLPARPPGVNGRVHDEFMATGAVVAGRGTFEPARGWGGDHHDGVPIFILAREAPGIDVGDWPLVTYVPDVVAAMTAARDAAGGKDVLVHGATVAQLALEAGVLDQLEIHLVPVLLGEGRRLFGDVVPAHLELERTRVLEGEEGMTHLRFAVRR